MNAYEVGRGRLIIKDKVFRLFKGVDYVVEFSGLIIAVLEVEDPSSARNIVALDVNGKEVWRIQTWPYPRAPSPYRACGSRKATSSPTI